MSTIDKNCRVNPETLSSSLLALSMRKAKIKFLPDCTPRCPVEIAREQTPLILGNISESEFNTLGKSQEAVGRLKILDRFNQTVGSGSAVAINRTGMFVTAKHVLQEQDLLKSLLKMFTGIDDHKFEIELYKIDPDSPNGYKLESYPVTILDYDTSLDIALIKVEAKEPNFISLKLDEQTPKLGSHSFKIGHISGKSYNSFSSGVVINPKLNPEIAGERVAPLDDTAELGYIVSDNAVFYGDSGGALVGDSGKVIGMVLQTRELGETSEELLPEGFRTSTIHTNNNFTAISASSANSILPYLDKVLGSPQFKKILDGEDVVVNKDEINRSRPKTMPGVIVFVIG